MSKTFYQIVCLILLIFAISVVAMWLLFPTAAGANVPRVQAIRRGAELVRLEIIPNQVTENAVQIQIAAYAGEHADLALAVAFCESRYRPDVVGQLDQRDRGLFQINSRWNPKVSDACAFSIECSTKWFVGEVESGRLWKWDNSKPCWSRL